MSNPLDNNPLLNETKALTNSLPKQKEAQKALAQRKHKPQWPKEMPPTDTGRGGEKAHNSNRRRKAGEWKRITVSETSKHSAIANTSKDTRDWQGLYEDSTCVHDMRAHHKENEQKREANSND